jgi:hypothetical protein
LGVSVCEGYLSHEYQSFFQVQRTIIFVELIVSIVFAGAANHNIIFMANTYTKTYFSSCVCRKTPASSHQQKVEK